MVGAGVTGVGGCGNDGGGGGGLVVWGIFGGFPDSGGNYY